MERGTLKAKSAKPGTARKTKPATTAKIKRAAQPTTGHGGMVQAHVIRFVPPFEPKEASTPHYHEVDFQMIYVLKGWYKTEFERRRRPYF